MTLRRGLGFWGRKVGATLNYDLSSEVGWLHCYSLAKRFPLYSGPCLRVRRDSDLNTLDIGFDGELVDLSAINAFCAGSTGRISIWYDQTGSGNNLVGIGALPIIYQSGVSNYRMNVLSSGFEFNSDFQVTRDFSYITNTNGFTNPSVLPLNRRGGGNRGISLSTFGSSNIRLTYYGVSDYNSQLTTSGLQSTGPTVNYTCWFHDYNTAFAASSYVSTVQTFKDLGSRSIGTMLTTTIPTRLNVLYDVNGNITGYGVGSIRECFFFSVDQRNNMNIFNKKLEL